MDTGEQVIQWIDQNAETPLTEWQQTMTRQLFDPNYRTVSLIRPRRSGLSSLTRNIEQALSALGA